MYKPAELELQKLLGLTLEHNASDLHLAPGEPPILRVDGQLIRVEGMDVLTAELISDIANVIVNDRQKQILETDLDVDLSYSFKDQIRFRVNVYKQQGVYSIAFRMIPNHILTLEELGLPGILREFTKIKQGLVLMVGPTGHGKTTALASLIEEVNMSRAEHILTIEDPVEFVFKAKMSLFSQREVNSDTTEFAQALRSALREDINVVMVGEIRDLESVSAALTLAETGHLIFATLHTNDAAQSIDRIVDIFPSNQQPQIRSQLASVLVGVSSLRLLPRIGGGRAIAYEILMANHAVKNVIRENKIFEISNIIHTSAEEGMVPLDRSLASLVKAGIVEEEVARNYVIDNDYFDSLLR